MFHLLAVIVLFHTLQFLVKTGAVNLARNGDSLGVLYSCYLNHAALTDLFLNNFRKRRGIGLEVTLVSKSTESAGVDFMDTVITKYVPFLSLLGEEGLDSRFAAKLAIFEG